MITCPNDECGYYLGVVKKEELAAVLTEPQYCEECNEYYDISLEDVYIAYKVILAPDASEAEITKAIESRLNQDESTTINFHKADSLTNHKFLLYEAYYNPSESAYEEFKQMRADLDKDYGDNTTLKGKALEDLVLKIFKSIYNVKGTTVVRTNTNQFDCTFKASMSTTYPSIFNLLSPYFIVECKNEPEKKPGNTYFNKLLAIMEGNEAKLGIVCARKKATKTYFDIAHNTYLRTTYAPKREYLISMDDSDLEYLIEQRVNLLEYLDFKVMKMTMKSPTMTWESFQDNEEMK